MTQSTEKWIFMGKWPVPSLAEFIHHVLVVPCVPELFPSADGSLVLGNINFGTKRPGDRGKKIHKLKCRGPIFANIRRFLAVWALLLKIKSAITPSILEVRGSSLDSKKLAPTHFNSKTAKA